MSAGVDVTLRPLVRAAVLLAALAGCATPLSSLRQRAELDTEIGPFAFSFSEPDGDAHSRLERAVRAAAPKLSRWGGLRERVQVWILPNHAALEEAVGREGYGWLRAWARYDEIFIQSPRTWGLFGARQAELDELVLHELTHCVMYQESADRQGWAHREIPLWFREGMASVTASQGYRWPGLEALARFYERNPTADPIRHPEVLYRLQSETVYAAAHHAFAFLLQRYGEAAARRILNEMSTGRKFPEAFASALGLSPEAFLRDFGRYVRWRGFVGAGRLIPR